MAHLIIEPSGDELATHSEAYERLHHALTDSGHSVRQRPARSTRGIGQELLDVALRILDAADDHAIDAIVAAVVANLAGRRRRGGGGEPPRNAVIFGPNGEELRRVEL